MWETFTEIPEIILKTIQNFPVKIIGSLSYVAFSFLFDTANSEALLALFLLLIGDFIFGVWASYRTGQHIQSKRIFKTVIKIIIYYSMVMFAHLGETAGLSVFALEEIVIAFLAITELVSIFENLSLMGYGVANKVLNKLSNENKFLENCKKNYENNK